MEPKPFTTQERQALAALLDDASPAVHQGLLAEFVRRGSKSVEFLRELARQPNRLVALHAARFLCELKLSDPVGEFRSFIQSLNYELESGALLLSRTMNADLDVGACCAQLDALAARCRELIAEPASTREKCRLVNRVLFHEFGLHANVDDATDPLNSFLDQVIARRKGLPLSLSIVYLLVAERLGLHLEAVALPGHFLVGCYDEGTPFFIDPFNAGTFLTAGDVLLQLRRTDSHASVSDLSPTPVREVLCRCCRNLVLHYAAANQPANASLFADFVAEFEATHERHAQS